MKKLIFIFIILYSSAILSNDYKIDIHGKIVSNEKHKYSDKSYYSILKIDGTFTDNFSNYGNFNALVSLEIQNSTLEGTMQRETQIQRGLRAFVENVDMPGRTLDTTDYKIYGPRRQVVTGHSFSGEITMSMYCDKFLRQRSFFEMWQKAAFDQGTNNVHFYEDYIGAVRIYQLGAFAENADRDRISYGVHLFECFPKTISAVTYGQGQNDEIQKISVSLAFRNWQNLTLDQVGNYTIGGGFKKPEVVSADRGLIGNILQKLPPDLRRAGRDAVNVIKQRVPIGAVFNGKVFPPLL